MNKDLLNYISRARGAGVLDTELRDVLLDSGWLAEEINEALAVAGSHLPIIHSLDNENSSGLIWTKAHTNIFKVMMFLFVLMVVGGVVVLAYQGEIKIGGSKNLGQKALVNLSKVTTFEFRGDFFVDLNYQPNVGSQSTSSVRLPEVVVNERSSFQLGFSGIASAPENKRPRLLFNGRGQAKQQVVSDFNFNFESRLIEDELYLYLSQLDELAGLKTGSLMGFWLKVVPADMAWLGTDTNLTAPAVNQMLVWRSLIAHSQSFHLGQELESEEIDGKSTTRYSFTFDNDMTFLIDQIVRLVGVGSLTADLGNIAIKGLISGEVWLGDKDNLPYRVALAAPLSGMTADGGKFDGKVIFNLNLSDFDKEVEIDRPEGARSLSALLQELTATTSATKTKK